MLKSYKELKPFIDSMDAEIAQILPTPAEDIELEKTVPKLLEIQIHIQNAAAREKFDPPVGRKRTLRQFD